MSRPPGRPDATDATTLTSDPEAPHAGRSLQAGPGGALGPLAG